MTLSSSKFLWTALALASATLLAACGGGSATDTPDAPDVGSAPVAAATQATTYVGPISGFGSIIVNGMRFSSVGASLQDDDGLSVNLSQLKLGMTVRVSGDADDSTQLGTASQLEVVHGNRGTITAVDAVAGTLSLLGQTVTTNAATAYQGAAGLAALSAGQAVEVFGVLRADGSLLATLVEIKPALNTVSLIGNITALGTTSFTVGTLTVNFSPNQVTGVLAVGARVKVKAASGPVGGVLTASSVHVAGASSVNGSALPAGARLKIKGVASAAAQNGLVTVSGTAVNVSGAAIKGGSTIATGQLLEVKGTWDGSVLQATQVELEGYRDSQIGGSNELYGAVSSVNGNTVTVNGVTVDLSRAVFSHGAMAQVLVGSYVEIKGSVSGNTLVAAKIELRDTTTAAGLVYEQSGPVSDFVSTANFKVNGLTVDASKAKFEHGSLLSNGVYVEIKGAQNSTGVYVATKVEIKNGSGD